MEYASVSQWGRVQARYATSGTSRGRLVPEPDCVMRSPYQRDRDRIVHCSAFRRLTYKTQVFIYHEGDHFRTRLTHSLEVAQIARTLARALMIDEDLAEALALAHDLGHTPFGHAGEEALQGMMQDEGGFDHNAQSLRIVTKLEHRYAVFEGLNLSWETLEGLVKHNGPLTDAMGVPSGRYAGRDLPLAIRDYAVAQDLELSTFASLEAQVAAIADDIAYNNHDVDDGIRGGLLHLEDLRRVPPVDRFIEEVEAAYPGLPPAKVIYEVNRRLITAMVFDVLGETRRRLAELNPSSVEDVHRASQPLAGFSAAMADDVNALRKFLYSQFYTHPKIARIMASAQDVLRDLFRYYLKHPEMLPEEWRRSLDSGDKSQRARVTCDFIAGMTDRFAIETHKRLFDATPELR